MAANSEGKFNHRRNYNNALRIVQDFLWGTLVRRALMISCKTFADALRRFAISESSFAESSAGKAHAMVESANSNVLTATKELPTILWMYFICCLVSGSISGPVVNIATRQSP